jgi:hypothetical protein
MKLRTCFRHRYADRMVHVPGWRIALGRRSSGMGDVRHTPLDDAYVSPESVTATSSASRLRRVKPMSESDWCQLRRSSPTSSSKTNALCLLHQRMHPSYPCGTGSPARSITYLICDTHQVPRLHSDEKPEINQSLCSVAICLDAFTPTKNPTTSSDRVMGSGHRPGRSSGLAQVVVCIPWIRKSK